jgi:hypothetical protein
MAGDLGGSRNRIPVRRAFRRQGGAVAPKIR